jgi:hypothetical protein
VEIAGFTVIGLQNADFDIKRNSRKRTPLNNKIIFIPFHPSKKTIHTKPGFKYILNIIVLPQI